MTSRRLARHLWWVVISLLLVPMADAADIQTNIGDHAALQTLTGAVAITCGSATRLRTVPVVGSGGPVTMTANPQIVAGTSAGQLCIIRGTHETNTVTLVHGLGLSLISSPVSVTLGLNQSLWVEWTGSAWVQTAPVRDTAEDYTITAPADQDVTVTTSGSGDFTYNGSLVSGLFTHATDCLAAVTTARRGQTCLDLDDWQEWVCQQPALGNDGNLCDQASEWVGGRPIWLTATGRLLYYPTTEANAFKICEDATEADCHLFYIDATDGLRYKGRCANSTCDTVIDVDTGKNLTVRYGTTDVLQMLAATNDLRPTSSGWISPRSGTASPSAVDCDAAAEAGRIYVETDQADASMWWVCKGAAGWKQQTGGGGSLTVTEVDASPSVSSVTSITLPNGTLTNNGGGSVTYTPIAGGGTGIGVAVRRNSNQSIPDITSTSILFNVEEYDTDAMHDLGANTDRLVINTSGTYVITCHLRWAASTGSRQIWLEKTVTGPTVSTWSFENIPGDANLTFSQQFTRILELNATDYLRLMTFQDSTGALNVLGENSSEGPYCQLQLLTSGGGGSGAPTDATYITQTANGSLSNEQALGALASGILRNTTTTGVLSIATAGTDYTSPSSIEALTNKAYDVEATGNTFTTKDAHWFPAAGCNNATAGAIWDLPTSNAAVPACVTGTVVQKGVLDFADGANLSAQIAYKLPSTWVGAMDATIKWFSSTASTNAVVWQLATICVADGEVDDPASFNTASTVVDPGKGTTLQTNDAPITGLTTTGCAAGELLHLRIARDSGHASDLFAGTARLIGVELIVRRAL